MAMASYLIQTRWGRALLHLAATLRAGHWSWHVAGIIRELGLVAPVARAPKAWNVEEINEMPDAARTLIDRNAPDFDSPAPAFHAGWGRAAVGIATSDGVLHILWIYLLADF